MSDKIDNDLLDAWDAARDALDLEPVFPGGDEPGDRHDALMDVHRHIPQVKAAVGVQPLLEADPDSRIG